MHLTLVLFSVREMLKSVHSYILIGTNKQQTQNHMEQLELSSPATQIERNPTSKDASSLTIKPYSCRPGTASQTCTDANQGGAF